MTDFYLSTEDGLLVKTDTDLELIDDVPDEQFPWLLWTFVKVRNPLENALPSEEEEALLYELRHEVIYALHDNLKVVYAGSRLVDGWFELYFYAPSPKRYENVIAEAMKTHPEYAYESGARKDAKWEHYLHCLYPTAREYQQIQTRQTLLALTEEGDDLAVIRPVEHYLFFKTRSNEERFSARALDLGFEIKEQVEQEDETYAYGVILEQQSAVTFEAIEQSIDMLFDAAAAEHGIYEGWSTVLSESSNV